MKIHLWSPELAQGGGGIEVYSADWLRALIELYGESAIRVLTKNDTTEQLRHRWGSKLSARGSAGIPNRLRTPAFTASIVGAAIRDRPDLIVSTHVNFSPAAAWLKRTIGSRYLLTLHGIDVWGLQHPGRKRGIANADLNVPISAYTAERVIQEQGMNPEKVRILRCVADTDKFQIGPKPEYLLKRYGLTPEQPVILTVGRLAKNEAYKGHDRILRILSEVRAQISEISSGRPNVSSQRSAPKRGSPNSDLCPLSSDFRYLIVGDGDDRPRLEALADELGVRDMVAFAGKVPAKELCDHYNLCDLFAMPSTGEGFGIVFLEALACGKPVIAGSKDASRDAVLDGELGVLVDPDSPQELAEAIVAILARQRSEDRGQVSEVGGQGSTIRDSRSALRIPEIVFQPEELREKVIEHFGFEKFKQRLGEILAPLLESRRAKGETWK